MSNVQRRVACSDQPWNMKTVGKELAELTLWKLTMDFSILGRSMKFSGVGHTIDTITKDSRYIKLCARMNHNGVSSQHPGSTYSWEMCQTRMSDPNVNTQLICSRRKVAVFTAPLWFQTLSSRAMTETKQQSERSTWSRNLRVLDAPEVRKLRAN